MDHKKLLLALQRLSVENERLSAENSRLKETDCGASGASSILVSKRKKRSPDNQHHCTD
jgi:hypothetical protein